MQHSPIHSFIGVLCLLIGSAIQVHASENTTYVEADQDRKDLGYDGYNVTTFQTGRYLVEAVMLDGSRDRKVVIDTDGQTWAELDVVTELDQGSFWGEFVDQSTAIVEIDGEFALEAVDDGTGTFVVSDSAFDEDWPWASMGMAGVVMADTNLSAELDVLDFFVAVGDAVVVLQNPGAVCHAANCAGGNITDYEQCKDCCNENCTGSNAELIGCHNTCYSVWKGTGVPFVALAFLLASVSTTLLIRRKQRRVPAQVV